MYLATVATKLPMVYNLDLQPAVLVSHIGLLPIIPRFSFRPEPSEPKEYKIES
jgi:hypothetical protein